MRGVPRGSAGSSLTVRRVVRYEQIIIDTNFRRFRRRFVICAQLVQLFGIELVC